MNPTPGGWLAKGRHVRKYSHTTSWSRDDRTYKSVHYWTPSTAGKTPLAVCSAERWERWKKTAHECSDPTLAPDVVEVNAHKAASERLARAILDTYNRIAPAHGFKAPGPWDSLHEARQGLWVGVASAVLLDGAISVTS